MLDRIVGRYECVEDNHCKFWEIEELSNGFYRAKWGKIGKPVPPKNVKDYPSSEILKKVAEKIRKGYEKVN